MPIAQVVKEALKRGKRTEFKELSEVPKEIKDLPVDKRIAEADKFLAEDKAPAFAETRQQDIALDTKATYAEQSKVKTKQDEQRLRVEEAKLKVDEAPVILDAASNAKLQRDRGTLERREQEAEALAERERNLYLKAYNLKKEKEITATMQSEKAKGTSFFDTLLNTVASTPGTGRTFANIESRTDAIYNRINTDMFELKEGMRTKWLGMKQDIELADEVIRYLKDGTIKNQKRLKEVKEVADQWVKASEKVKGLRNKAGARIGKLEDWILPQSHDARKIRKAGYKSWVKSITPKLDRARIETEQGTTLENVLESAYKNVTTPRAEVSKGGTSVVAKRGEDLRVLHFKDSKGMIDYKNEFGNPDTFATMDAHIRQQSNEIATMQLFGANPEANYNRLKELARADGMGKTAETHLDQAWKLSTGQVDGDDIVSKLDERLALIGGTHRAIQISSKLGSAMVSSLADISSIVLSSGYRGLSSINILGKGLHTLLQEATTVGNVSRNVKIANRIGVVSEFASASLANSRYAEVGAGAAQKVAEVVIRASGLGSYTNSMRAAVGLELAGNFAEHFNKSLNDTPFAGLLKEYGITSKEWNIIRGTETYKTKGAEFFDTKKLYEVDEELGYKVSEMISNEMDAFVIMPTNRTRIWTTWGEKKGTIKGEAARNMMLFKSFPIASTLMHLKRVGKIDTTAGRVKYGASLVAVNTIMGGVTLWAYDTVRGHTPRSVDRPAMIGEALTKSGGLGIFGDFFLGLGENQYGHSFSETLAGVPASTLDDIVDTAQDLFIKDQSKQQTAANIYNRAKSYIPGQNLWYTRTVIERTIGDFMGEVIDPKHELKKRRRAKVLRLRDQKELLK